MITAASERARYNASEEDIAAAEALFDATAPTQHKAASSPFHQWLDQVQSYFLNAARRP